MTWFDSCAVRRLAVVATSVTDKADGLAGGGVIPCAVAVSRMRKLLISPIALIIGAGTPPLWCSSPLLARPASANSAVAGRAGAPSSCPTVAKDGGSHRFTFGGNDLARFSRSASACAMARFMLSGNGNVLQLDEVHFHALLAGSPHRGSSGCWRFYW
jgi:hypothetical protein